MDKIMSRLRRIIESTTSERNRGNNPTQNLLTSTGDTPVNEDFRMEEVRLRSYRNWPAPYMNPTRLAVAGFYYTGENDRVKCFECKIEICLWTELDDPIMEHQRGQENCRFIRGIPCGNIPINKGFPLTPLPRLARAGGRKSSGVSHNPDPSADGCATPAASLMVDPAKLGMVGIHKTRSPQHPEFGNFDTRLETFKRWPNSMPPSKERLAAAGFFYLGEDDNTRCYHCGGGLTHWEPLDDPWEQHAIYFSKCYHLLTIKGQAYINMINKREVSLPSMKEIAQINLPGCERVERNRNSRGSGSGKHKLKNKKGKGPVGENWQDATGGIRKTTTETNVCLICYDREFGVAFLPCGHISCKICAAPLKNCPFCRQDIGWTVRIFPNA